MKNEREIPKEGKPCELKEFGVVNCQECPESCDFFKKVCKCKNCTCMTQAEEIEECHRRG